MDRKMFVRMGVALSVALFVVVGSAQAELVSVVNPSFESQVMTNGALATPVTGWTYWTSGQGAQAGSGVVVNPTGYDAPDGDTSYGFTGASGDGTPLGGDGANVAWEYEIAAQYGMFQQVLETTFQAGSTYTLTVALGKVPTGGQLQAQLFIAAEEAPGALATLQAYSVYNPADMTAAEFVDGSVSFTCETGNPLIGQKLMIGLCGNNTGATAGRIAFDNVRVDVVPEPGTLILLGTGLFGLLAYAWRKRN